jgi:hypothetical protein
MAVIFIVRAATSHIRAAVEAPYRTAAICKAVCWVDDATYLSALVDRDDDRRREEQ